MKIHLDKDVRFAVISNHAVVFVYPDRVVKVVNRDRRVEENADNGYRGEGYFLEKYKSPFFVNLIEMLRENPPTFVLENVGEVIGSPRLLFEQHRNETMRQWLEGLDAELQRSNIAHGDITPANIMYNSKYTLIDFEVATEPDHHLYNEKFAKDRYNISQLIKQTKGDENAHT